MPAPPNMLRTATRPKAENSSAMWSGSMTFPTTLSVVPAKPPKAPQAPGPMHTVVMDSGSRACARPERRSIVCYLLRGFIRGRELDRFATAAGGNLVGIVEHELRGKLVDLEVHLGAEQEQHRLRIDQDAHSLVLDDLVGRLDARGIFHRVGHPGAATVLDPDTHARDRPLGLGKKLLDARGGGIAEPHHLRLGSHLGHSCALLDPYLCGAQPRFPQLPTTC